MKIIASTLGYGIVISTKRWDRIKDNWRLDGVIDVSVSVKRVNKTVLKVPYNTYLGMKIRKKFSKYILNIQNQIKLT